MSAAGIVAEYNPLHTGHFYHITQTRNQADGLVIVMSGNAVQRGGPAFFSKWDRARAAVLCGADLVLELPAVWACAPAERFAAGAVEILAGCGCVSMISCGSESGDSQQLRQAADAIREAETSPLVARLLKTGITYAAAREEAVRQLCGGQTADLLRSPNNILAIEYLKANAVLNHPMDFFTVRRQGAAHDSDQASGQTASASMLRSLYAAEEGALAGEYIPPAALEIFTRALQRGEGNTDPARIERAILYRLKTASADELKILPDISEGLENRFLAAARTARSLPELLDTVKTKRYTLSRLRRIIWNLMLGNTRSLTLSSPPYLRVLDFNQTRGRELLRQIKKNGALPVFHSMADLEKTFPVHAEVEKRATMLFNLCCPEVAEVTEYPKIVPYSPDSAPTR
ncbi:MAG TPA: nucleotidyltransferase family protein [Candidatus Faecivivens stercorigallinarum]|nr:nucleotidyltransferase family protein [Candidatus Faecivivens stercorigallinarum]